MAGFMIRDEPEAQISIDDFIRLRKFLNSTLGLRLLAKGCREEAKAASAGIASSPGLFACLPEPSSAILRTSLNVIESHFNVRRGD
jgi:hypothetical protein